MKKMITISNSRRAKISQFSCNISSYFSDQSKVNFKRHGVVINKFGARGAAQQQVTVEVNPDLIKVLPFPFRNKSASARARLGRFG